MYKRPPKDPTQKTITMMMYATVVIFIMAYAGKTPASVAPNAYYTTQPTQHQIQKSECTSLANTRTHLVSMRSSFYCYTIPEFNKVWFPDVSYTIDNLYIIEGGVVSKPQEMPTEVPQIAETPLPSALVLFMSVCAVYVGFRGRKRYV